ncbi:MAG: hypothetical protein A3C06_03670 [Candidatus Taylorbacteria bacterium RIFCSPHIGHO2_02_FULL_46_13]|uniref:Uncharacterized protein n=1 Tax=Candidatus Taylorbacteria bacterium RIFCSPHIGHO2_02_FULL_46_13 TaxID=1802312 RepID=A0A1G2MQQ7_9BACT|nr:MAG: hypothetical protein A3C06_03670 [Candidatus Taylorbacteria bacterium RIFCSPHIGHO2_02_FULL_46_13]
MNKPNTLQAADKEFEAFKVDKILKEGLEGRFRNPYPHGTPSYYEHEQKLVAARAESFPATLGLVQKIRRRFFG